MTLEANLEAMAARAPETARRVREARSDALDVGTSRAGAPTLGVTLADGRRVQIYSAYDPARQAAREVDRFRPAADGPLFVAGVGFGYHLAEILKRHATRDVVAVEPDAGALRVALSQHDWTGALRGGRLTLVTSPDSAAAVTALRCAMMEPRSGRNERDEAKNDSAGSGGISDENVFRHAPYYLAHIHYFSEILRRMRPARPRRLLSFMARGDAIPPAFLDAHAAFRALGCDVRVLDLSAAEQWDDIRQRTLAALADTAPDAIFTLDAVGLTPEWFAAAGVPVISWYFDNPYAFLDVPGRPAHGLVDATPLGDNYHIFCWDREYVEPLRDHGFAHVSYLPFAANPEVYATGEPTAEERERYGCEVAFVGNSGAVDGGLRREMVRALSAHSVHLWGDEGWRDVAGGMVVYRGRADNRTQAPAIYRAAAINLNVTAPQLFSALPIRVFDVLCAGGFLLSDLREDLTTLFREGEEVVAYGSADDLREKAAWYLSRPEERRRIAAAAAARVRAEHTYVHRAETILKSVFGSW